MGRQTLTLRKAWGVYDRWLEDPRVEFYPEPRGIDPVFRQATFAGKPASKWVGDCCLPAYATHIHATLVTFDAALRALAHKQGLPAVMALVNRAGHLRDYSPEAGIADGIDGKIRTLEAVYPKR